MKSHENPIWLQCNHLWMYIKRKAHNNFIQYSKLLPTQCIHTVKTVKEKKNASVYSASLRFDPQLKFLRPVCMV